VGLKLNDGRQSQAGTRPASLQEDALWAGQPGASGRPVVYELNVLFTTIFLFGTLRVASVHPSFDGHALGKIARLVVSTHVPAAHEFRPKPMNLRLRRWRCRASQERNRHSTLTLLARFLGL
jgi:hypothetical protein